MLPYSIEILLVENNPNDAKMALGALKKKTQTLQIFVQTLILSDSSFLVFNR